MNLSYFPDFCLIYSAVDSRTEVQAAVWRLPSDFDNSMNEDHTNSHQPLQLLCSLDFSDYGEIKW